ncbi:MAG: prephenate dehydrogenase [Chloroflexota bacterium]
MTDVTVIGLGLIGGSLAEAARKAGFRVRGYDPNAEHAAIAVARDLVDEILPSPDINGADFVLLAAPVPAILQLLRIDGLGRGQLVMDTASVKQPVVAAMGNLEHAENMIGGHPLGGREVTGPSTSEAELIAGRPWALTPNSRTREATIREAGEFVAMLGACPRVIDAPRHDEIVARTSHVPMVMSTALALSLEGSDISLSGPALADMTRIASGDPSLWKDILLSNREPVLEALDRCVAKLTDMKDAIRNHDSEGLGAMLATGRREVGSRA